MTEATQQTATSTDAREASMSRVQTQESVLASLNPPTDASTQTAQAADKPKDEGETKAKKSPQERIVELAHKRREAEEKAAAAEQRANAVEAELKALRAQAKPIEATAKPDRNQFKSDAEFIDALTDWKAKEALAQREREQAEARRAAEQAEVTAQWNKRQDQTIGRIPDYLEVVGKSDIQLPDHVTAALLESDQGPELAYYLALHPDEAKKIIGLRPIQAIKQLTALERQLAELNTDDPDPAAEVTPKTKPKPKAPEPITPVRSAPSGNAGPADSFAEYKRRRQAK